MSLSTEGLPSQASPPVRVLIVDDEATFRDFAKRMIGRENDMLVVAEAKDGTEAMDAIDGLVLDLVLMDVQMPVMNGFEATRRVLELCPAVKVLLTSSNSDREYGRLAVEAGAVAFIAKRDLNADVLREAAGKSS